MPASRAQPQSHASGLGSSHYRTKTSSTPSTTKTKGKGKARDGGTGLETPAMTPLPFPMQSLPPPALPSLPTLPIYPPHSGSGGQPQGSSSGSNTEAALLAAPAPNPDVYPPMAPTPSATPVDATTNSATLETGNVGAGPAAMTMRRIVSAPLVPTQQQLQEQRLHEQLDEEKSSAPVSASSAVSRSPPRKRLKQSDFLANVRQVPPSCFVSTSFPCD